MSVVDRFLVVANSLMKFGLKMAFIPIHGAGIVVSDFPGLCAMCSTHAVKLAQNDMTELLKTSTIAALSLSAWERVWKR